MRSCVILILGYAVVFMLLIAYALALGFIADALHPILYALGFVVGIIAFSAASVIPLVIVEAVEEAEHRRRARPADPRCVRHEAQRQIRRLSSAFLRREFEQFIRRD